MKDRLQRTEKLLEACESDLQILEHIRYQLEQIEERRKQLESYYENQYMEDYDHVPEDLAADLNLLNQDSIWNVLADQHVQKIILLKTITNTL